MYRPGSLVSTALAILFVAILFVAVALAPLGSRAQAAATYTAPPGAVGPVAYLAMPDKGKTYRVYQMASHTIELEVNYGSGNYWYGHDLGGSSLPLGANLAIFRLGDDATVVIQHSGTGYDYAKTWPIYTDADFAAGYAWVPYWHYTIQSNP